MSKWQTIYNAPRDGSRFLAAEFDDRPVIGGWTIGPCMWCKTSHVPLYGFHFTEGDVEDMSIAYPTHWMPYPEPPELVEGGATAAEATAPINAINQPNEGKPASGEEELK